MGGVTMKIRQIKISILLVLVLSAVYASGCAISSNLKESSSLFTLKAPEVDPNVYDETDIEMDEEPEVAKKEEKPKRKVVINTEKKTPLFGKKASKEKAEPKVSKKTNEPKVSQEFREPPKNEVRPESPQIKNEVYGDDFTLGSKYQRKGCKNL